MAMKRKRSDVPGEGGSDEILIVDEVQGGNYGETVKPGQWGYKKPVNGVDKIPLDRDPADPKYKKMNRGTIIKENKLDRIFNVATASEKRAIRNLVESWKRKDLEVITVEEMTLASNAVCNMMRNLTSATKKRDPPTFRTRYEIITFLISREFDRLSFTPNMLTKNQDITSTLNLVEQELVDLKERVNHLMNQNI